MESGKRQLVLNKGAEKFIFRYAPGEERALLDALVFSATDDRTSFDWFDAAVLSFRLTQSLIHQADHILQKDFPEPLQYYERANESEQDGSCE